MKVLQIKMIQTTLLALWLTLFTACGGGGTKSTDTNTTVPDATSITHNGTTYGFVTSPHTGKVWLDRNLGAAEICAGFDDAACYGDYYQWGRGYDGHQESNSGFTDVQATNVTDVGHGDFIQGTGTNYRDWARPVDASGSRRTLNWSKTDGTSVCPLGFRVPTIDELKAETLDNGVTNKATAVTNFLKLPSAGDRNHFGGSLERMGLLGYVWSSSASLSVSSKSSLIQFNLDSVELVISGIRSYGFSVRCLKD